MDTRILSTVEQDIVDQAISIIESKMRIPGVALTSPQLVKTYLKAKLALEEQEVFCALFLDNQNRVIEFRPMFYGTINAASVYPREVVKAALTLNAAALIIAHNHPSGESEPSRADIAITEHLINALKLVDIRVLDHIVVGSTLTSFVEKNLI